MGNLFALSYHWITYWISLPATESIYHYEYLYFAECFRSFYVGNGRRRYLRVYLKIINQQDKYVAHYDVSGTG